MRHVAILLLLLACAAPLGADEAAPKRPFVVTDAGQTKAYDTKGRPIEIAKGHALYGQDAHVWTTPMRFPLRGWRIAMLRSRCSSGC